MNTDFERIRKIFWTIVEQPSAQWEALLNEACGKDPELRQQVAALLQAHEKGDGILDRNQAGRVLTGVYESGTERPGTLIGPYKLLQQIGEGGMGVVWMAEQTQPVQRKVALKIIKPGMDSRQVIARFEAERQALALMDHVNIARVFDGGATESGRPYFVMELVHGVPITKYCDDNQLTPRERLELFVPVCQAIQHAHQKGIIHRDIKPSNVMITLYDGKPVPKVIDFGVAKATEQKLTERTLFTQYGTIVGTLEYMSPEQAEMSALGVDTRSDIYSLGALLYELLTGTTPLSHKRLKEAAYAEILRMIKEEEPPKPSTRLSESGEALASISAHRHMEPTKLTKLMRGELDWIVMKTLEKDRNRRYDTASAFAADVQRYLDDEPVQAHPPSARYRLWKFARRNKRGLLTGALLGVMLLAAAGAIAGSIGWVARDREVRLAETAGAVTEALDKASELEREGKWPEALAAARRAEGLLEAGGGDNQLRQRVRTLLADLAMVAEVEEIRLRQSANKDDHFDFAGADAEYIKAFRDYGIDVEALDPSEATDRIRASAVKDHLVAALFHWANVRKSTGIAGWEGLLEVARQADPAVWLDQLSDALAGGNQQAQEKLVRGPEVSALLPPKSVLLARALAGSGNVPLAVEVLRHAQQRHPGDFWINFYLALYLDQVQPIKSDEVIRFLTAAVAIRPKSAGAHINLAKALLEKGAMDDAIKEYRTTVEIGPKIARAHNGLGNALRHKKRLDDAIKEYRTAIELDPKDAIPHYGLGLALLDQKQLDEAIKEYRTAIELDPKFARPHIALGVVLRDKKQLDEAIKECRTAIELDPKDAMPHNNLGNALSDKKQLDEAIKEYHTAIELDPKFAGNHHNLGAALRDKKQLDEAIKEYRTAIELDPKDARSFNALGNALRDKKQLDEAIKEYRTAIELDPKDPMPHNGLGNALSDKKQLDEAIKEYRTAIELDPKYASPHNGLGNLLSDKNQLDEAIKEYCTAIDLGPYSATPHTGLGVAMLKKGNPVEAIAAYREVLRLGRTALKANPNSPGEALLVLRDGYWGLTHALVLLGDHAEAAKTAAELPRVLPESWEEYRRAADFLVRCVGLAEQDVRLSAQQRQEAVEAYIHQARELFQEGSKRCPDDFPSLQGVAWFLANGPDVRFRDPKLAVKLAQRAVQLAPEDGTCWITLGLAQYRVGNWEAALEGLEKAMPLRKGGDPADWFLLAMVHWQLGDKEKARQWYDRANEWMATQSNAEWPRFRADAVERLGLTRVLRSFKGHTDAIHGVAVSADGRRACTAGIDGTLRLWDVGSGKEGRCLRGHSGGVTSVALTPDGSRALSGGFDKTVRLWDAETGKELKRLEGHTELVEAVAYSPDGRHILSGSRDKTMRLWDAETGKELRQFEGHTGSVRCVAFSPDGKRALTASFDKTLRLWDVETGKELRQFTGHTEGVICAAFAPDGRSALSGGWDKTLRLWDVESGQELRRFEGHTGPPGIECLALSADGRRVVSGADDATVRLWDVTTGKELYRFDGHEGAVWAVVFSPDGDRVLSACGTPDGTMLLWELPEQLRNVPLKK